YRGEFLPRFETVGNAEFGLWVEAERADLGRRFARSARQVLGQHLASARDEETLRESVALARRLRDHDTLAQDVWQLLIQFLTLRGEHDEAAVELDRLQALLA